MRSYKESRSHRPASTAQLWLMAALILIATAARVPPLLDNRFHPDEALFATLARLMTSGRDPTLSTTHLLVDKPPLFYYTLAGSIILTGGSELAARLPGFLAGMISLALVARLAWQLWRSELAAWLALAIMTLSPFAILFAPTAFADPQFVMWLLASLAAVCAGRWGWSGLLLGLAVATKQNALFFLPLVLMLGVVQNADAAWHWRKGGRWAWRFASCLTLALVLMFLWDSARRGAPSYWASGALINNPGRLARSREVWPRAVEWMGWLHYMTALDWLNVLLAILLISLSPLEVLHNSRARGAASSLVLLAYVIGYLGLHWLVAFPLLDRYLLPLVPLLALLIGRSISLFEPQITQIIGSPARVSLPVMLAAILAWPAWQASNSGYPVGGDHGAYDGIDQAADYLRQQPLGSVVYYRALGWLMDYYLFDAYLYPIWVETPAWLARDLAAFGHTDTPRYLILSKTESQVEFLDAIQDAGCQARPGFEPLDRFGKPSLAIYRVSCGLPYFCHNP